MEDNNGKLLGLYDELSMFLAQMNDSQQVSTFLQLYGSDQWIRRTGVSTCFNVLIVSCTCIYISHLVQNCHREEGGNGS